MPLVNYYCRVCNADLNDNIKERSHPRYLRRGTYPPAELYECPGAPDRGDGRRGDHKIEVDDTALQEFKGWLVSRLQVTTLIALVLVAAWHVYGKQWWYLALDCSLFAWMMWRWLR